MQWLNNIILIGGVLHVTLCPILGFPLVWIIQNGIDLVELHLVGTLLAFGAVLVEICQRFFWWTKPGDIATACQEDDFIRQHHVLRCMGTHENRPALIW